MSKKNTNLCETNLHVALNAAPDFTGAFTNEVMLLQHMIADELSAPVEHDDDMNYSSAQKLVIWLDKGCHFVSPRDAKAAFRLVDLVSSRGRFFTIVSLSISASTAGWKEKGLEKPSRYWTLIAKEDLPNEARNIQKKVESIMESNHYELVRGSVLHQEAAGHWTKLDGRPATVFEVLFSEEY